MLRIPLLIVLLTSPIRTLVTDHPSFADRLDKLYEKLEKFTISPDAPESSQELDNSPQDLETPEDKLYAKIDRLNSLAPEKLELTDEDEELLSTIRVWGMLSADQMEGVVQELQKLKSAEEEKHLQSDPEYSDVWIDGDPEVEGDYPNDDWDGDYTDASQVSKPSAAAGPAVTPSAFTRPDPTLRGREVLSAADPIAATDERPKILDDSNLTPHERSALRQSALAHVRSVLRSSKCLTPQPRWLSVRQLAPAADIVYLPPCVQLHRCAPDAGCCSDEAEVCAPVAGRYVVIPFYLNKADGQVTEARMEFFNHTRCACVSRDTLQSTIRTRLSSHDGQVVRRASVLAPDARDEWRATEEPRLERDEEPTPPPQLRRCTCPALFLARMLDNGSCSCICDWPDLNRRRDCISMAKGKEHFGMRDRVCVAHGDCTPPTCEYGAYERSNGRCPHRRFRRVRFQRSRYQAERSV